MHLRGSIFQNFLTKGQGTSLTLHQWRNGWEALAHVPPKENLLPPLTSENKRPGAVRGFQKGGGEISNVVFKKILKN